VSLRPRARARWSLVAAGFLVGAGLAAVAAVAALVGAGPVAGAGLVAAAASVGAGIVACLLASARRASGPVLVAAATAAAVALAAAAGLVAAVLALGRLPVGTEAGMGVPLLVGVAVAAALAGPLARRAARTARAALQGTRRSPDELLAALGADGTGDDDLLRRLAESLRREHRLARVQIWSAPDDLAATELHRTLTVPTVDGPVPEPLDKAELALLARSGVAGPGWLRLWLPRLLDDRPAQLRLAPAVHGGQVLALIVVERAADADAFTGGDERALAEVARRLAIVLRNRALDEALALTLDDLRQANADLQASRARLVSTADAERRRIERDLHDGAQQHLVAIAVGLRLVRDTAQEQGNDADVELLDELDRGVRESISALRDLAHGIYPPLLRDAGLGDALRAAAARGARPVQVLARDVGRHPEPIEAAVYFCCLEAVANAAKHAPEGTVRLTLEQRDGGLRFEVADTGPGFDPATTAPGAGRQNMADRLGAVGGSVRWISAPGAGTTVTGVVPLDPRTADGHRAVAAAGD
jgi:signal transduction histidine kinase